MKSILSIIIFSASLVLGQSGYFDNSDFVINRRMCSELEKNYQLRVQLDDSVDDVDWILRRTDDAGEKGSCPVRPTLGKTILNGGRNPEAFRFLNLALSIDVSNQQLTDGTAACSENGMKSNVMLCLYAKEKEGSGVNLVAEMPVKIYTVVRSTPAVVVTATSADELALQRAVQNGNHAVAKELLGKGVNPEAGWLLYQAAAKSDLQMVKLLVDYGAALDSSHPGNECNGPLEATIGYGDHNIIKYFIAHGYNPRGKCDNLLSRAMSSPTFEDTHQLLLDSGAVVNEASIKNMVCNAWGFLKNSESKISKLKFYGANFNQECDNGYKSADGRLINCHAIFDVVSTPCTSSVVKAYLEAEVDLSQTCDGSYVTCYASDEAKLKLLQEAGAKPCKRR